MSRWLLPNEGAHGERLFKEESLHDMWQLTTPLPVSANAQSKGLTSVVMVLAGL